MTAHGNHPKRVVRDRRSPPHDGLAMDSDAGRLPRTFGQLGRRERMRLITIASMRTTVTVVLLLILYAIFPVEPITFGETFARLILALAILGLVVGIQVRAIMAANYPQLRATEAVVIAVTVFVVLFSLLYLGLAQADAGSFSKPLDRVSAFYFTVTVLSTVGFGDIVADTDLARLSVTVQMLLNLTLIAVVVRVFFSVANSRAGR
jgi:hypothetical protein